MLLHGHYDSWDVGVGDNATMPDALRAEKGYYTAGGCDGNIAWHTEHDLINIAKKDILLCDIKVCAQAGLGLVNAQILPLDWTAATRELPATVASYQKPPAPLLTWGQRGKPFATLSTLVPVWARCRGRHAGRNQANTVVTGLARILVPINSTREPRFRHDPAVPIPPLPTLSVANELGTLPREFKGFAKTQLTRRQNRVVAAMRAAVKLIATAV